MGGTSVLLVKTLFPHTLRGTTIYKVTIGLMQQFVIERVVGIKNEIDEDHIHLDEDFVQRKIDGNIAEAASLLKMGYSQL